MNKGKVRGPIAGWVVGLGWLLVCGLGSSGGRADEPKGQLTPEQRKQLEARAEELSTKAEEHQKPGRYQEAAQLYQQALTLRQQLYPKETYPLGHADLAKSLDHVGSSLRLQGQYAKAETYLGDALTMRRQLYPKDQYPHGHADLAQNLNDLGRLLQDQGEYAQAEPHYREGLAMLQALYPKEQFPQGDLRLANLLYNLGYLLDLQGNYVQAEPNYHDALAMYRLLYPRDKFPQGHPNLARGLNNLGDLLLAQGEYARAEPYYREALRMYQQNYPKEQYPQGHLNLASTLNNLGRLFRQRGDNVQAERYFREAVAMVQQLYPEDRYPQGHPYLATCLHNLGFALKSQGEFAQAEPYLRQALAMRQRAFPKDRYPLGHPDVANGMQNLGSLLREQGDYAQAEPLSRQAVSMQQQLYPKNRYPQGHPSLALSLHNLAALLAAQGANTQAEPAYRAALTMYQTLTADRAQSAAEAQALNFAAALPAARDGFLSVTRHVPDATVSSYGVLWQSKAALTRVYERRHQAVLAATSPEVQQRWQELLELRRQRERLLLAPVSANPRARDQRLAELNQQIDQLDRELVRLLPAVARAADVARSQPAELQKQLPPGCVLIDLLRYVVGEQDPKLPGTKGLRRTPSYLAYVVSREAIERVELGPAQPIEQALQAWRQSLTAWRSDLLEAAQREQEQRTASQAETVRRLVWEPLARHLPAATKTVYLAPDATLTQLPWAALPGQAKGRVLLEEHALAVLPHGPFLLDQLTAPARPDRGGEGLLVVGAVRYDGRPTQVAAKEDLRVQRSSVPAANLSWEYLAGSKGELDQVAALAQGRPVRSLSGVEASTERLLAELPRVRYAHLATHGFFADKAFRSVLQLDEQLFARRELATGQIGERIGEGARNPLVLSGLVLAGANQKDLPDRGILTADAIVGLNLSGLELAVLSACETGLGDVAGGEGVFGLQRAFHLAGTKHVMASLWKVDDQATAALMTLFYRHLWHEKLPPIEALRQAQLALYRHPEQIPTWAQGERGPGLKPQPATTPAGRDQPAALSGQAPVKLWAAFVLSGSGQ